MIHLNGVVLVLLDIRLPIFLHSYRQTLEHIGLKLLPSDAVDCVDNFRCPRWRNHVVDSTIQNPPYYWTVHPSPVRLCHWFCWRIVAHESIPRGCGLMIHSRGANASTAELVWTQILQGAGGLSSAAMQVGAQASVTHADVAMVTAIVLLVTEIGGAIGSAVGTFFPRSYITLIVLKHSCEAGAIWSGHMPDNLAKNLPQLSAEQRAQLFGSITDVLEYPRGDPVREGVIEGNFA